MSDTTTNGIINATSYDYLPYDENDFITPCEEVDLKNFGMVFVPTLYSLVFIIGFLGNSLVVCVLVKHRNQTNLTDICLFNLALSDLLFVFMLPFYSHYSVVSQWTFGSFMCHFISGCHNVGFFSSIFFLVAMTLDRYIVILYNHRLARRRTLRAGVILSVLVWLLSVCVSLPNFIFTKITNDYHGLGCTYEPDNIAWRFYSVIAKNMLGLVIPLLVMVVCYSRIIPALVNMRSAKKHRVVKLIASIVVIFFVFWVPYNVSFILCFLHTEGMTSDSQNSCEFDVKLKVSVAVTESIAYTHCCLNPIIYAFVGQKFMKRTLQLLRKWVPGMPSTCLTDRSVRKSSVMSRSSDVTPISIM
ncbi:C-C chemokine receptor type 2-like [Solea senegalensis]|uniref:C-C chemokine receptor type 2-like n=1 Tax=Solea senegalensis TaxID=28829 RepID=A0AAV6PUC4_SOLSE|nr:C-C chemokine receptor type 3-like [Solea senegalensis]KAG7475239.1 C-C chemokine receptor type 2-like [Solea senegalensis]